MRGGHQVGGPPLKRLMSRTAGLTLHWFAGVPTHDPTNNFKLYSRRFLDTVTIESTAGFELALELTVKATIAGRRVAEVPTTWRDRTAGQSNFKLRKWLPHYLHWYWVAFRATPVIHRAPAAGRSARARGRGSAAPGQGLTAALPRFARISATRCRVHRRDRIAGETVGERRSEFVEDLAEPRHGPVQRAWSYRGRRRDRGRRSRPRSSPASPRRGRRTGRDPREAARRSRPGPAW